MIVSPGIYTYLVSEGISTSFSVWISLITSLISSTLTSLTSYLIFSRVDSTSTATYLITSIGLTCYTMVVSNLCSLTG